MGASLGSLSFNDVKFGTSQVSALYLGTNKFWPLEPTFVSGGIFIGGYTQNQATLQSKLTGENLTSWAIVGGNTVATSSTNYTINPNSFQYDTSITSYIDNGKCTFIDFYAFQGMPNFISASFLGTTFIQSWVFYQSNIKYAYFPEVITLGDEGIFQNCQSLEFVYFPKLVNIQNPPTPDNDGSFSFAFSSSVDINDAMFPSLKTIGDYTFNGTRAKSVNLSSVESIGNNAFNGAINMISSSFSNAKTVGANAFLNSFKLTYINLPSLSGSNALGGTTGNNNVFFGIPNTGSIIVPSYLSASNAGTPDGDLVYLKTAPRNWTINYI